MDLYACGCSVSMLDENLLNGIKEILLEPSIITSHSDTDKSIATIKTENEINRILESIDFDRKLIINKIFELASLKYEDLDSDSYISNKIRAEFDKEKLLTDISLPLLSKTVKEIRLNKDADISLLLKNNQNIGKEECYGSKSSQIHCTAPTITAQSDLQKKYKQEQVAAYCRVSEKQDE